MYIRMYKLAKQYRRFGIRVHYYKAMRLIEITLFLWNIMIAWGKDEI